MDPGQTAPWSSLIRVHIVCFHENIPFKVHLNKCSRCKKQTIFSRQKDDGWIRVKSWMVMKCCVRFLGNDLPEEDRADRFGKTCIVFLFVYASCWLKVSVCICLFLIHVMIQNVFWGGGGGGGSNFDKFLFFLVDEGIQRPSTAQKCH